MILGGIERNFSLEIDNVQWDDQGDYNCVAINQGGMAEKNITLTFSHPTTWAGKGFIHYYRAGCLKGSRFFCTVTQGQYPMFWVAQNCIKRF